MCVLLRAEPLYAEHGDIFKARAQIAHHRVRHSYAHRVERNVDRAEPARDKALALVFVPHTVFDALAAN